MSIETDFLYELNHAEAIVCRLLSPTLLNAVIARSLEAGAGNNIEAYATYIGQVRLYRELAGLELLDEHTLRALTANMKSKSSIIEPALDRLDAWHQNARAHARATNISTSRR